MLHEKEGKLIEAVDCYETAYRLDKTSPTRLRNYALLLIEVEDYEKAKTVYEEILLSDEDIANGDTLIGDKSTVIGEYADLLHSMGLMAESRAAFERAVAKGTANDTVINDYAALLYKIGKNSNDARTFRMAVELWRSIKAPSVYIRGNLEAAVKDRLFQTSSAELLSCVVCGDEGKSSCSKCKQVRYCGRECQLKHWPIHKRICKKV
jgi:tetratricopeptide (TPR) repeat protein